MANLSFHIVIFDTVLFLRRYFFISLYNSRYITISCYFTI